MQSTLQKLTFSIESFSQKLLLKYRLKENRFWQIYAAYMKLNFPWNRKFMPCALPEWQKHHKIIDFSGAGIKI